MQNITSPRPEWEERILSPFRDGASNVFLVHGNVYDYAQHNEADKFVREYLTEGLAKSFSVVRYSVDEGITFGGPDLSVAAQVKKRFERVVGLAAPDEPTAAPIGASAKENAISRASGALPGPSQQGAAVSSMALGVGDALPLLATFLRRCTRQQNPDGSFKKDESGKLALVIIDRMDLICPPSDKGIMPEAARKALGLLARLGTDPEVNANRGLLIMLSPSLEEVHPDLRVASTGIVGIEIPPPTYEERLSYIERLVASRDITLEVPLSELAGQTAGLDRRNIETLAVRAEGNNGVLTREMIKAGKKDLFKQEYSEVLEILEPDVDFSDVGGHELAKQYLLDWIVNPFRDEELRPWMPIGITFMGPAGTGKTFLVRALAKASGMNCVLFRQGKLKGPYVGESERRLEKALKGLVALAPAIVFIDELDQGFKRLTGGSGGGGDAVEGNIFGRMLEFVSDTTHRGSLVFIGATNQPQLIDPAFKRPGRLGDAKIPLLPPDSDTEREKVIRAAMTRYSYSEVDDETMARVASMTSGRTQAELDAIVIQAQGFQRILKRDPGAALLEVVRRTRASTAQVEYWTKLALAEATDIELVPESRREQAGVELTPSDVPESLRAPTEYRRGRRDDGLEI